MCSMKLVHSTRRRYVTSRDEDEVRPGGSSSLAGDLAVGSAGMAAATAPVGGHDLCSVIRLKPTALGRFLYNILAPARVIEGTFIIVIIRGKKESGRMYQKFGEESLSLSLSSPHFLLANAFSRCTSFQGSPFTHF
jgi:hypothetical protein